MGSSALLPSLVIFRTLASDEEKYKNKGKVPLAAIVMVMNER
jgi:hypothetical protein